MTMEQILQLYIGQLVMQYAAAQAQIEALKAQLSALQEKKDAVQPS